MKALLMNYNAVTTLIITSMGKEITKYITCGPVYILAVQAGCSGVLGAILPSIQGEEVTETPTRQGNMAGYAKYSQHHWVIQLLLTIGSSFTDLIHKVGAGGYFGHCSEAGISVCEGVKISPALWLLLGWAW
ncbi:hypothetical protein Q5P01_007098 [Channa striata]|uniref:Uncharacterized protein n=1 Tax=Channa striata TaxID=64152 RepID=A0AA88N636_CHASR|nr:hypothetical protein Q5P01_007098 [Channa striata]